MSSNRKKKQKKQLPIDRTKKRSEPRHPSPTPLPLELTDMPSMDELLQATSNIKKKCVKLKQKSKSKSPIKKLGKAYRSNLDFNDMTTMDKLLSERSVASQFLPKKKENIHAHSKRLKGGTSDNMELPLGSAGLYGMEELLRRTNNEVEKKELLTGTVRSIHDDKAIIDLNDGSRGIIFKSSCKQLKEWISLHEGDQVLVSLTFNLTKSQTQKLTFIKILSRGPGQRPLSKKASANRHMSGCRFIIDGSNVCRSYMDLSGISTLSPLLTLAYTLFKRHATCFCFFDASERYLLRGNLDELEGERVYERMLREFPRIFYEVPAGENADDLILEMADRQGLGVISNDRFNKMEDQHLQLYPWLILGTDRLIRGNVQNGMLNIEHLGIHIRLRKDLNPLLEDLCCIA